MYSICEFARLAGVSARMLRHYDAIGLFAPAVVDESNSYRFYSVTQLGDLIRIVGLREMGFSLAQTKELISALRPDEVQERLVARAAELQTSIETSTAALRVIEARLRLLRNEEIMIDDIILRALPALRVVAVGRPAPGFGPNNLSPVLRPSYAQLRAICARAGIDAAGPRFAFYTGDPEDGDLRAFAACPVDDAIVSVEEPARVYVLPAIERAACVIRTGAREDVFPKVYIDLGRWLEANGLRHVGAGRDIIRHLDPQHPSENVYEINLPCCRVDEPVPDIGPKDVTVESTPVPI
jgi:DNA-binding transcriptional MerR regulator